MADSAVELLDQVRGLVATRTLINNALANLVEPCLDAGVDASMLAAVLGVHRSTFYRRYLPPSSDGETRAGQGRPEAGEADP